MIAADSSAIIAYLTGATGPDVDILAEALARNILAIPPVVLTEVLSDPQGGPAVEIALAEAYVLDIGEGYWHRAAALRRELLGKHLKARMPDALIAQSCIDHEIALITRDRDFRHFAKHCGLKLA